LIIFFGGISADKNSMQQAMKNNKNITLIPGGFEEASIYQYNKHRLYLR
jgi:2-acylglycerol O-acyltransferase 2